MLNVPKIKNFMTDKMLANIFTDFNQILNIFDLKIDKRVSHHFDEDRQNTEIGNYFPSDYYTMQLIWKEKIIKANKIVEVYKHKVGTIIFDQFYAIIRLNLPEEYLVDSVYTEKHIYTKLNDYIPNAILFQMYKEYGFDFVIEFNKHIEVLNIFKAQGKEPPYYLGRSNLSFTLGAIYSSITKNKDLKPRYLLDLEKREMFPNYNIEETNENKVLLLEGEIIR